MILQTVRCQGRGARRRGHVPLANRGVRRACHGGQGRQSGRSRREMADVLAWLATLANIRGIDLDAAVRQKYGQGCPGWQRFLACATLPRNRSPAWESVAAVPRVAAFDRGQVLLSHCLVCSKTKIGYHDIAAQDQSLFRPLDDKSNFRLAPLAWRSSIGPMALHLHTGPLRRCLARSVRCAACRRNRECANRPGRGQSCKDWLLDSGSCPAQGR